jgi:hypothetical protein
LLIIPGVSQTKRRGPLFYHFNLKPRRAGKRKNLTLVAAFRCYEGVIICADSQETLSIPVSDIYAEYRCQVDKIDIQHLNNYDLAAGGAGHGPLIDGFHDQLSDAVRTWDAGLDATTLKEKIRQLLFTYHRNEVALCASADKDICFIVCLKHRAAGRDPMLWYTSGPTIRAVESHVLIGWEEPIYRHFVDRLYRGSNDGANRALIVGLYVMLLGKSTSNVIGGRTKVIKVTPNVIREESADSIAEVERRMETFARILEDVTLWCPDASVSNHEFPAYLDNIEKQLMSLREQYFGPTAGGFIHHWQPPTRDE